jgi:ATP-dependent helicase/nuclease subunit A
MPLTPSQQKAVSARGNVLVVAGAGTGKTSTLVERCIHCLEASPPASIDEILMVTFTEAAAAEMRQRIRARLEEQSKKEPENPRWQEQLALFETAHIGTLHSFCLQLIRQHFYQLELDPQLSVLHEEEAWLLANETLDEILQHHYAGETPDAQAVQELIQVQGGGSDGLIRSLILRLHNYTQTLPEPEKWFREQLAAFSAPRPAQWESWLLNAIAEWRQRWLTLLGQNYAGNGVASECFAALKALNPNPARSEVAAALKRILAVCQDCPYGKKTDWLKPLENFQDEAEFLFSLTAVNGPLSPSDGDREKSRKGDGTDAGAGNTQASNENGDPLEEDWNWVRGQMLALLNLAREFGEQFRLSKRELGMVDFHDLEQYALRLLWDAAETRPTKIAREWREKLRFVFVDEYQDINAAQDKIIQALGRGVTNGNRFLVGDVKQSIYRFRLANPRIFQDYAREWRNDATREAGRSATGATIPLVENFRSREGILNFVNSFFPLVMRSEIGGVAYNEEAKLRFGAPVERGAFSAASNAAPRVELHVRIKKNVERNDEPETDADETLEEISELHEVDKEARLIALRLRELKQQGHPIWDEEIKQLRAAKWGDMAILLRSPTSKAESYAKEFARLEVPLQVARGGFYDSMEILDLLSLLQLLDNPLQDLPGIAVLHSPLVGLTANELAEIRLAAKGHFWRALLAWHDKGRPDLARTENSAAEHATRNTQHASYIALHSKISVFLEQFTRWRRLARQASLSRCLEAILAETHYDSWLLTQPRGPLRHANVRRLLGLAQQFDQFQRQSLFRFLKFVEAQKLAETEPDAAATGEENAVRLMSIHQSKGLEFPIVVVADLGKAFNPADLKADIILDEEYGLCPQIKPPDSPRSYPSLPYWLARQRQGRELLGEELRLLYVAMTRARDALVLSGTVSENRFEKIWTQEAEISAETVASARSYSDWLGLWFSRAVTGQDKTATQGETADVRWMLHSDASLQAVEITTSMAEAPKDAVTDEAAWERLRKRIEWRYLFPTATREPAKTTVSALRRRADELMEDTSAPLFQYSGLRTGSPRTNHQPPITNYKAPTDCGRVHHTFLQFVSLERVGSTAELKAEAERLVRINTLSGTEAELLDFDGLAAFWNCEFGERIRAQIPAVRRELAFTIRYPAAEIAKLTGEPAASELANEFVIVQGIVDLAVLLPDEIWIVDFKTDAVTVRELPEKTRLYEPQVRLYSKALSEIYQRPVSECRLYFVALREAVPIESVRNSVSAGV